LTCRAESIPNATVSWFLNGRNLENDNNIRMNAFNGESTITVFIIIFSLLGEVGWGRTENERFFLFFV
jgi:hypothetical protein